MLPLQPASAFAVGRYAHVPLLQGTNHDEGRFFVGFGFDALGKPLTAAQSRTRQIGADRRPGTDRPISADGTFPGSGLDLRRPGSGCAAGVGPVQPGAGNACQLGRAPPNAPVTVARAQRIRSAAVSGCSP